MKITLWTIVLFVLVILLTIALTIMLHSSQSVVGLNSQPKDLGSGSESQARVVININNSNTSVTDNLGENNGE